MRTITRFLRRFLILLIVFVIGVAGTAFLMNNETTDDRSDMNNPTLPEVMVDFNGTLANRMYGYRQPMEADFVRDSVTPVSYTHLDVYKRQPINTGILQQTMQQV